MTAHRKNHPAQTTTETDAIYSIEALEELKEELRVERDLKAIDTAHTDGSTTNPHQAQEQGLVYNPPSDPPVLPSDDPQGARIAAGFADSMEAIDPNAVDLPERVDNQDLDLEEDILTALQNNSETAHLSDVTAEVNNGVAFLRGTVPSADDIPRVDDIVSRLEGIYEVRNQLTFKAE
ncbi:MAG: BON domain-containing protein [Caldilineaceae bacterium]